MHRKTLALSAMLATAAMASTLDFAPHAGKVAAEGDIPPVPPVLPVLAVGDVTDVSTAFELPVKSSRGGGPSPYKFADLAAPFVGPDGKRVLASFGVVGKTKKNLNSTLHTANKNARTMLFNADGSAQTATKKVKNRDVPFHAFTQDKEFEAFDVTEDGGVTVRVFRIK